MDRDDMVENNIDPSESISDHELIQELKTATEDLLWFSESEYPLRIFYWRKSDFSIQALLQRYNYPPQTKVVVKDWQSFFASAIREEDWYDEIEIAETRRYQNLVNLMAQNMKNIRVYLVGEIEIDVYILGETESAIAGLTTKIIAT